MSISSSQARPLTTTDLVTSYRAGRDLVLANTGSGWEVRLDTAQSEVSLQGRAAPRSLGRERTQGGQCQVTSHHHTTTHCVLYPNMTRVLGFRRISNRRDFSRKTEAISPTRGPGVRHLDHLQTTNEGQQGAGWI